MFFASLRRKANPEGNLGPIRNSSGSLSTSLSECLENWASFYENLYKGEPKIRKYACVDNPELDRPFTFHELVLSMNEFRDNKAPGQDLIATDDLTVLLHTDPEDPSFVKKIEKFCTIS